MIFVLCFCCVVSFCHYCYCCISLLSSALLIDLAWAVLFQSESDLLTIKTADKASAHTKKKQRGKQNNINVIKQFNNDFVPYSYSSLVKVNTRITKWVFLRVNPFGFACFFGFDISLAVLFFVLLPIPVCECVWMCACCVLCWAVHTVLHSQLNNRQLLIRSIKTLCVGIEHANRPQNLLSLIALLQRPWSFSLLI